MKVIIIIHSQVIIIALTFSDVTQVRLINEIGQGSFGTVYKSVWRGSVIATKVIQLQSGEDTSKILGEVEKLG